MFLNFGRFFGFGIQSKMDTLLKQDNLTLETILNEEDILSELKNQSSGKFADFIVQHPNEYSKMIYYITNDVTDREQDRNTCIKYPFLISEILGSENEKLINFLFEKQGDISQEEIQNPLEDQPTESQTQEFQNDNENLRQKLLPDLLSILEHDSLLITSAGYFTKIISAIIHKRGYDFWEYLKSNPEIISNLFKHANIRHITEIFEKLIILDTCQEEHEERLFIQERQLLIARLLKYLKGQSHQNTIITNVCESLIEVYKRALMSLDTMEVLREILLTVEKPVFFMSLAFDTQNSSLYNLLNVQYEFYNKMSQLEEKHYDIQFSTLYKPVIDESTKALIQQNILRASFQTTYGATVKPLGDSKLALIQLIVQLLQRQELTIIFQKGQIFQQVINLVLDYQTNNQLHILFDKMIVAIIDSKQPHLHELLFQDTNFLNFLIINNGIEERKKKHGYQGILTKITNYINSNKVLEQNQAVQTAIANIQIEWQKYIEELKVVNQIEQVWLLGINPRFREQVNVDLYSPPLLWPDPTGSSQYQTTNNQTAESSEAQQDSQEENSTDNQYQNNNQQTDQFDLEEAQIENEKEAPLEVVQVKEENLEQLEEQQIQKHEEQILDSPVYVSDVQLKFYYENVPEQTQDASEQQPKLIAEEQPQEITEKKEESNQEQHEQNKDQIQEEQNLNQEQKNQEEQQPKQEEQQKNQEEQQPNQEQIQQNQEEQQPKQEEQQQNQEEQQPKQEEQQQNQEEQQQNHEEQQPKQEEQQQNHEEQQPKQEEQLPQKDEQLLQQDEQKLQVQQQEPQTENNENQEQIEQSKQPQEEA
ncbi:unnamed protein product [Paramecium octaurelia]|uniref:Uncharacterized protein n=1 Tax=Paramecium octaurelia TaxID=43137 RepID=A0A8S1TV22_PAROT|nr:unnamed protein product [Paramecium octaurelia]